MVLSSSLPGRSRSWVAEEGEVFRKGNVLLGPEEMEGEYDGEELRREVCGFALPFQPISHIFFPLTFLSSYDDTFYFLWLL